VDSDTMMAACFAALPIPQFWWCGWEVAHDIPPEHMCAKWPQQMRGWRTGSGYEFDNWAGLVWAATEDDAREIVCACYAASADRIPTRWDPEPKGQTWVPTRRFWATDAEIEAMKQEVCDER